MTGEAVDLDRALPEMRAVASRLTPTSWQHPGQITWSARYALPEDLDHGPVRVFHADGLPVGWAWVESPGWMEWCVDPAYAGVADQAVAWFLETTGSTTGSTVRTMTLDTEPHLVAALVGGRFRGRGRPVVQPAHPGPEQPSRPSPTYPATPSASYVRGSMRPARPATGVRGPTPRRCRARRTAG